MIASHMFAYPVTIYIRILDMGFTRKEIQESLLENSYEVCATYHLLAKEVLRSREVSNLLKSMSGYWAQLTSLFGALLHLTISYNGAEYRSSTALPLIPPGILTTDPKQLNGCSDWTGFESVKVC